LGSSSLALAESTGQYIDDATITTKVKAALLGDSQLKATQVKVETSQGTVQLSGRVDSKTQETQAVQDANQVKGVVSVKDMLTVRNTSND
jgi:osmotically-inducible protein OsmY